MHLEVADASTIDLLVLGSGLHPVALQTPGVLLGDVPSALVVNLAALFGQNHMLSVDLGNATHQRAQFASGVHVAEALHMLRLSVNDRMRLRVDVVTLPRTVWAIALGRKEPVGIARLQLAVAAGQVHAVADRLAARQQESALVARVHPSEALHLHGHCFLDIGFDDHRMRLGVDVVRALRALVIGGRAQDAVLVSFFELADARTTFLAQVNLRSRSVEDLALARGDVTVFRRIRIIGALVFCLFRVDEAVHRKVALRVDPIAMYSRIPFLGAPGRHDGVHPGALHHLAVFPVMPRAAGFFPTMLWESFLACLVVDSGNGPHLQRCIVRESHLFSRGDAQQPHESRRQQTRERQPFHVSTH